MQFRNDRRNLCNSFSQLASAFALSLLVAVPAGAAPLANAQINQAIKSTLAPLALQEAKRQGWPQPRLILENTALSQVPGDGQCAVPLLVQGAKSGLVARQHLLVTCSNPGWQLKVSSELQLLVPVVYSRSLIDRGASLSADMLKTQELDLTRANRGFYIKPETLLGLTAKRRIRPNQLLTPSLIDEPLLVRRGDKVKVIAEREGIAASVQGEALDNGAKDAIIRVKNSNSGKTLKVKVIEQGLVTSSY